MHTAATGGQDTSDGQASWWAALLASHARGDLVAARALWRQGRAQGFDHPLAAPLGLCLDGAGRLDEALLQLLRAGLATVALPHAMAQTHRYPAEAAVWKLAGLAQRASGDVKEAEACYRQALQLAPDDTEAHYNLGNLLRARGEAAGAEQHYRAALAADARHVPSLNNFALLLEDLGRNDEAAACLQQALQCQPQLPELHNNLGLHWARRGDWPRALACYQQALALDPNLAWSNDNAAQAYWQLGQLDQARRHWRQALRFAPNAAESWESLIVLSCRQGQLEDALSLCDEALSHCPNALALQSRQADVLFQLGRHEAAETAWRRVLSSAPAWARACHGLGLALAARGCDAEALDWLRRALAQCGPNAALCNDLGNTCFALGYMSEALSYLRLARSLDPQCAHILANLANVLRADGREEEAEACYREALRQEPDRADWCSSLACLLLEAGRRTEGEEWMDRALRLAPAHPVILANALQYLPFRDDDPRLAALDTLYSQRGDLPAPLQARLAFAMGRVREQRGQYPQAFAAFSEGNRLRARMQPWDEAGEIARLAELRALLTPALFARYAALAATAPAREDDGRVPVFIVGLPRSGSTLVEQILVSQGEVYGAGEQRLMRPLAEQALRLLARGEPDIVTLQALRVLGRSYKDALWRLAPTARSIADKMPGNVFYLGLIHLMLPEARFIHTMRDLRDVCVSCFTVPFHAGHGYSDDLTALGRHALRYRALARHWRQALPPGRVFDVRYEDLVADLPGTVGPLLDYLGLAWNDACLQFHRAERTVRTASAMQVRQPLYASAVARWRRYEPQLAPLLALLSQEEEDGADALY